MRTNAADRQRGVVEVTRALFENLVRGAVVDGQIDVDGGNIDISDKAVAVDVKCLLVVRADFFILIDIERVCEDDGVCQAAVVAFGVGKEVIYPVGIHLLDLHLLLTRLAAVVYVVDDGA